MESLIEGLGSDEDPTFPTKSLGVLLTRLRKALGLERRDVLAHAEGLPYTSLAGLESGDRGLSQKLAHRLAPGLGVDVADLNALWSALKASDIPRVSELMQRLVEEGRRSRIAREENEASSRLSDTQAAHETHGEQFDYRIRELTDREESQLLEQFDASGQGIEIIDLSNSGLDLSANLLRLGEWLKQMRGESSTSFTSVLSASGIEESRLEAIESGRAKPDQDDLTSYLRAIGHPLEGAEGGLLLRTADRAAIVRLHPWHTWPPPDVQRAAKTGSTNLAPRDAERLGQVVMILSQRPELLEKVWNQVVGASA